jgi:DNA-binding CsgD family transcriptional regulator
MKRAWRIEYEGAYYHLLSRGNEGGDIFVNKKAERILNCDVQQFNQARRLRGALKDNRDLLVYFLWRSGRLTNEQIGQLLGLSYSAVSHAVKTLKVRMSDNSELMRKFKQLNSQFKL